MKILNKLFKKQNSNDLITWFEEVTNHKYPTQVKTLLLAMINLDFEPEVKFEASNFGEFQILNFKALEKARQGENSSNWEESMSNPFYARKEIIGFLKQYVPNDHPLNSLNILPFARATYADRTTYVYFQDSLEYPLRINIDHTEARPRKVGQTIIDLIPINEAVELVTSGHNKPIKYSLKKSNKDLIDKNRILVTDGERVDDVKDYESLIKEFCSLTDGTYSLEYYEGEEIEGRRIIKLAIGGVKLTLDLEGETDWVDLKIIEQLNKGLSKLNGNNQFYEFKDNSFGQEFGVIYGNENEYELFKLSGFTGNFWD